MKLAPRAWMTPELEMLRDTAKRFFERECVPNDKRWSEQRHADREIWQKAGAAGLLCASIPEAYGGGGGNFLHEAVIAEAQAESLVAGFSNSVHSGIVAHYLLAYGTEAQKQRWLPRMATGECVAAIAMTEPSAGTDLQRIRTRAVREGDHYRIQGSKTFITNGYHANLICVAVKTDATAGANHAHAAVEIDRERVRRSDRQMANALQSDRIVRLSVGVHATDGIRAIGIANAHAAAMPCDLSDRARRIDLPAAQAPPADGGLRPSLGRDRRREREQREAAAPSKRSQAAAREGPISRNWVHGTHPPLFLRVDAMEVCKKGRNSTNRTGGLLARHATSTITSTSTVASSGSAFVPTAARAWRPASPKTSCMNSLAPLATFG